MRLSILLACGSLIACATAKNRYADEPSDPIDGDVPSVIDSVEVCEATVAKTPEPGADCDDPAAHGTLNVTVPDEHWAPTDTKEYELLVVHDGDGGYIGFLSSKETANELIAKYRERSRLDGETAGPTKRSKDGMQSWFAYSRTAGNGKKKVTVRGLIGIRELAERPGIRLILIGVWPSADDKAMRADFLEIFRTIAVE